MSIDLSTIFLVVTFSNVFLTVYLFLVWHKDRKDFSGIPMFLSGMILLTAGHLAVILQGRIPPFLGVIVSNIMIYAAVVLVFLSFHIFHENKAGFKTVVLFSMLGMLLLIEQYYFLYINPSLNIRIISCALIMAVPLPGLLRLMFRQRRRNGLAGKLLIVSLIIQLLLLIARIVIGLFMPYMGNLVVESRLQFLGLILLPLTTSALPFGFSLLVAARKQQRAEQGSREREVLLKELYHRVGNSLQTVSSLLHLQEDRTQSDEAKRQLGLVDDRIRVMLLAHTMLTRKADLSRISLREYIGELIRKLSEARGARNGSVDFHVAVQDIPVLYDVAIPLGYIITELIHNSYQHAFPGKDGEVRITLHEERDGSCILIVRDSGPGLPEQAEPGIGLQIIRSIAENQLSGTVDYDSTNGFSCTIAFDITAYQQRV